MLDRDYGHVLVDMGIDSMGVEDYLGGSTVRRDDNPLRPGCVPGNQKEENGCYKPGNQGTYSRTAIHHRRAARIVRPFRIGWKRRSEEHTSELQSREKLVCRLLPAKKN